jgi:hypothetical protein
MEEDQKKIGLGIVLIASLVVACMIPLVMGDGTEVISCTVTAGVYSVSLNRSTVTYGNMAEGENQTDPQGAINATNDAGIPEDIMIRGRNATAASGEWVLAGTPGVDQYRHTFNDGGEENLTTDNQMLVESIPNGDSQEFTLKIYVPTTISISGTYTTDVTVVATAP